MGSFNLSLGVHAGFLSDIPTLEILINGVVVSSYTIDAQTGSGILSLEETISFAGTVPSSFSLRFNDALGESGRDIVINEVRVNDVLVPYNHVSQQTLINTQSADIDTVAISDHFTAPESIGAFSPYGEDQPELSDLGTPTIIGDNGNNTISGIGLERDIIDGGLGKDRIQGEQGHDRLWGGGGRDYIVGDAGNDIIVGAEGNDKLRGDEGDDIIYGGDGKDRLIGGTGNDYLSGNDGKDFLYGQEGNDVIFGGTGNDIIYGHEGNNELHGGADSDKIYGGADIDLIYGDAGNDRIETGGGADTVYGGDGGDRIYGSADADTFYGDNGQDVLIGYAGNDLLYGGKGNDRFYGYEDNDTIYGEEGADLIYGGDGVDALYGGADDDVIAGGIGGDTIEGGDGNDALFALDRDIVPGGLLQDQILNTNPIAYWRLDETSGTTANNDGSGGALDSTYTNGVSIGAVKLYELGGTSADFDGVDDYVAIPNSSLINTSSVTARTVELVFNADTTAGRQVLYEEGGATNALNIYIDDGNIYFSARDSGEWGPFSITAPISAGETYHAALVLDTAGSGRIKGFLNGSSVGSGITATNLDAHSGAIAIGGVDNDTYFHDGAFSGNGHYFDGRISDVAIYNSVLSQDELLNHAKSLSLQNDPNLDDGNDTLHGGAGNDSLFASGGNDTLYGDADNDTLYGSSGQNTLYGGDDDDILYADGYEINAIKPILGVGALSAAIIIDNPDGYWILNESTGSNADNLGAGGAAIDGTYHNGVGYGAAALYTEGSTSINFDGVADYISVPDSALINTGAVNERTVELVFNADTTAGRMVLYEEGGNVNALTMYIDDGEIYFSARDSGEWGPFSISASITAGETYHAALVLDVPTGVITGYLDGTAVGTGVTATDLDAHSGDIGIGAQNNANYYHDGADSASLSHFFDGRISDIALYNAVLSEADIQERADIVHNGVSGGVAPAIDDVLYGGDGLDQLYGGNGRDVFVFESISAFNDVDEIYGFGYYDNDALDISDILTGFGGGSDINDFVQTRTEGGNTIVAIDANGASGGATFTDIVEINNITGLTADVLYDNQSLIV